MKSLVFLLGFCLSFSSASAKKIIYIGSTPAGNTVLRILEINTNLLHLLDADNQLLTGNGGWSYTLNNNAAAVSDAVYVNARSTQLEDSITFAGRSPCAVPGVVPAGKLCYKLK